MPLGAKVGIQIQLFWASFFVLVCSVLLLNSGLGMELAVLGKPSASEGTFSVKLAGVGWDGARAQF